MAAPPPPPPMYTISKMLSIPVKSITSGEMFTLTAASSTTIGELKAMMEAEHGGGPAAMQTFVLGGERLDNDLTIDDAGVEEETVVTWMTTYSPPPPLVLRHISGKQYAVEVNESTTGLEIKTMMSTKEDMLPEHSNIPPSRQLIICAGKQMQDEDTVGEIDLLEQSMVRWVVRPAPPPPDEPSDPVDLCFKIGLNPEIHTVRLDQEWTIARAIDELVTKCEALPEADGVRLIYGGEICDTEDNVYDYQFEEETCCQVMYIGEVPTPPVPPPPAPTPPEEEPPVEEPSLETISIEFLALTGARIECDAIADIPFGEGQDEIVSILDQLATALECPRDEIILVYGGDRIDLSATPDDYCLGCASVVNVMRMRVDPGASVADIKPITAHCQHCVRAGVKICLRPLCRECEQEQIAGFVAPEGFSGPRSAVKNGTTWNDLETVKGQCCSAECKAFLAMAIGDGEETGDMGGRIVSVSWGFGCHAKNPVCTSRSCRKEGQRRKWIALFDGSPGTSMGATVTAIESTPFAGGLITSVSQYSLFGADVIQE